MFKLKKRDSNLVSSLMMFLKKLMHLMTGRHWPGSVSDCDVEQKLCTNCPSDAEMSVTVSVATNKSFILFHKLSHKIMSKLISDTKKRIQLNFELLTLVECDATKLMMTPTLNNKTIFFDFQFQTECSQSSTDALTREKFQCDVKRIF